MIELAFAVILLIEGICWELEEMRSEHDETWGEKLGDACIAIVAILILAALLSPGWF